MTRRTLALLVSSVAAAVLAVTLFATRGDGEVPAHRALIPAYLPPAQLEALAEHHGNGSVLILNPASGPGTAFDPAYAKAIATAHEHGWRVIGYVPTGYGDRDRAAVEADAARYAGWYRIDGIFLDEVAHDVAHLPYYQALRQRIPGLLVINPGIVPDQGYLGTADVIVTYEGPYGGRVARPSWLPDGRAAQLVYATPEKAALALASEAPAGYLYVTSHELPDPWSALPGYLDEELRALMG